MNAQSISRGSASAVNEAVEKQASEALVSMSGAMSQRLDQAGVAAGASPTTDVRVQGGKMGNESSSISDHGWNSITNSYAYQQYQRQRQMTLGDLLLENRIVFLQGEIHTGNANDVVMKLLYLQSENKRKDIHFYINSPGGDVIATLAIYDTMQILTCPIATYCVGQAASGAAVLLAGGTKGKRFCLPHSRVMIHQPYGGVGGQVSDIEIQANEILRNRQVLNEIVAKHTGKPIETIAKDINRDFFMTAELAKQYGVVDEITVRPELANDQDLADDK